MTGPRGHQGGSMTGNMTRIQRRLTAGTVLALGASLLLLVPAQSIPVADAATPSSSTLGAPSGGSHAPVTQEVTWTGTLAGTGALDPSACVEGVTCDSETLYLTIPA